MSILRYSGVVLATLGAVAAVACSPAETSMVPEVFRDFDRVAAQEFAFLVDQKDSKPPTVEFWRDYVLVYPIAEDLQVRIAMERGTPIAFIAIHSHRERLVSFDFPTLLAALGLSVDSSEARSCARSPEWPVDLRECARELNDHFDAILARVRSASQESTAAGIGTVVPAGVPVIGAGAHFIHKPILPIERDDFWRLIDRGFAPSYSPVTCPLCGKTGNIGVRELKPTSFFAWFRERPMEFFCLKCDQISMAN